MRHVAFCMCVYDFMKFPSGIDVWWRESFVRKAYGVRMGESLCAKNDQTKQVGTVKKCRP